MKPFAILRDLPTDLTWEEMDAGAISNLINMAMPESDRAIAWEPRVLGVRWIRTYWEQGTNWATCLYTAPNEAAVKDWHDLCQVAYAGIRDIEVVESPEAASDYPRGFHQPGDEAPLVVVETDAAADQPAPDGWIRTYRDPATGREIQLFRADAALPADPTGAVIRRVVELRPQDYD